MAEDGALPPGGVTVTQQLAVATLLQRYAWASDQRDAKGLANCFCSDATMWIVGNHSELTCTAHGQAQICDWIIARHKAEFAAGHIRRHFVTCPIVSSARDHLVSHAYFNVLVQDERDLSVAAMGWYEDEIVCGASPWRIRKRVIHLDAKRETQVAVASTIPWASTLEPSQGV